VGYAGTMATVHLICGFLGAGKTTFARRLATEKSALRFSVDELYLRLFANGPTYELDQAALERLLGALNDTWPPIVAAGVDVVLDFGFWRRALRDEARSLARGIGAEARLYWLQCPDATAVQRCLQRNGSAGAFLISEQGYYALKLQFEPPGADEMTQLVDTSAK
jgi:predicted kinase